MSAFSGFRARPYPSPPDLEIITVRTERIDDHLPDGYAPTLIKIDVEGAERLVLEGVIDTIIKFKPAVVFEHGRGSACEYETLPADIYRLLCGEAGLRIFDLDGGGPYTLAEFETTPYWNFLAVR